MSEKRFSTSQQLTFSEEPPNLLAQLFGGLCICGPDRAMSKRRDTVVYGVLKDFVFQAGPGLEPHAAGHAGNVLNAVQFLPNEKLLRQGCFPYESDQLIVWAPWEQRPGEYATFVSECFGVDGATEVPCKRTFEHVVPKERTGVRLRGSDQKMGILEVYELNLGSPSRTVFIGMKIPYGIEHGKSSLFDEFAATFRYVPRRSSQ